MKMKLTATVLFIVSIVVCAELPRFALAVPFVIAIAFAIYGVARSAASRLDPLNDLPNALRVFLACAGGYLLTLDGTFVGPSLGIISYFVSVFLNDEYQRMALDSVRRGRKGGSVALLGIDGSGKSSHARVIGDWLHSRGYYVTVMPFHTYIFVERLASISKKARRPQNGGAEARRSGRHPVRPMLSLADNLILQVASSIGSRLQGRVIVYDRFIWSTFIKYEALRYPVRPLSFLYLLPRPFAAIILDVPVEKSLGVIDERGASHIHYPGHVLQFERDRYLTIARTRGYPVIDATASFEEVQSKIELHLSRLFPIVKGAGSA